MESDYIERINLKAISKGNYILKVLNKDYSQEIHRIIKN
jgi:hypothetical protein